MRTYEEYYEEAAYELNFVKLPLDQIPKHGTVYYAYKNGKAEQFPTRTLALAFSKNIESVIVKNPATIAYHELENKVSNRAASRMFAHHREDYPSLSQKAYDVIYTKAYDDSHSSGYDEVFMTFDDLYEFAQDFMRAQQESVV